MSKLTYKVISEKHQIVFKKDDKIGEIIAGSYMPLSNKVLRPEDLREIANLIESML